MCVGFPMRVVLGGEFTAVCERRGAVEQVSLLLVGPQPSGARLLVHLSAAVRVLGEDEARQIDDALDGLSAALEGQAFDHLFADLIDHEPELPAAIAAARPGR